MASVDAIIVLALVFWLNYVRLCLKHRSERRRREINRRRRHQARMRRILVSRRRMHRYHCVRYTNLFVCAGEAQLVASSRHPQGHDAATMYSSADGKDSVVQTKECALVE